MVAEAMEAAELLATDGISARVVDMFTIKPIDEDLFNNLRAGDRCNCHS